MFLLQMTLDERTAELQSVITKTETELALEKDKYRRLKTELSDTQNNSTTYESQAQTLQIQVTELQVSLNKDILFIANRMNEKFMPQGVVDNSSHADCTEIY